VKERCFDNVSELLAAVHDEQVTGSRFAVQFILVSGLEAWQDLLSTLGAECAVFRLSKLCSEADLLPYLGDLRTQLDPIPGSRILLLPLGEPLQLDLSGVPLSELAEWTPRSPKRVYVPVLERRDLLVNKLEHIGRYRAGECVVWSLDGPGTIDVHAVPFPIEAGGRRVVHGVRAYLELWEQGGADKVQLISRWSPSWGQAARVGRFQFHVSVDAYSVLSALIPDAQAFAADCGSEEEWRWLATHAQPGETFQHLAGRILNVVQADVPVLMAAWSGYGPHERWLAWLWARSMPSTQSFADEVVRRASSWQSLAEVAANVAIEGPLSVQHLAERRRLLSIVLDSGELPAAFWAALESQTDPLLRLQGIPGFTVRQKERIVREVRELLRDRVDDDRWIPILSLTFPVLATYLTAFPYRDPFIREYLQLYSRSRILDSALPALLEHSTDWAREKRLWSHPTRASILTQNASPRAQRFWVDALGIEWAGLLHVLLNDEQFECSVEIGRAELPTSTSYNREWLPDETVERELDNLAHALGYAFPKSFVQELLLIETFAAQIRQRCESTPYLLVTADHGLTRFAASTDRVKPPEGWTVHKWGRYAFTADQASYATPSSNEWHCAKDCLVLARHALFEGGTRSGGEVHGGALPEEALIPILMVRKRRRARPIARLAHEQMRPDRQGVTHILVIVNEPIEQLRLCLGPRIWHAERLPDNRWEILVSDLASGTYHGLLEYEGGLLGEVRFEILRRGITHEDMGLPDKGST